jgi:hypothetical protein
MTQQLSTNTFTVAKWVVSADPTQGTHTTIAAALTSASSGDTIMIRDGTYTENPTLKAGVDLVAFTADAQTANVIINGTITASYAGTAAITGCQLKTNAANAIAASGSNATILYINQCDIQATGSSTAISNSASNAGSLLVFNECTGNTASTSNFYANSGTGIIEFVSCYLTNSGNSTTANTSSAGTITMTGSRFFYTFSTSGSAAVTAIGCNFDSSVLNAITWTCNATTGNAVFNQCAVTSGSAECATVGAGALMQFVECYINSSGTNAFTGAGTIQYALNVYLSGKVITTTTKIVLASDVLPINLSTYLPALAFGGSSTGITYTTQQGEYYRVGKLVFYSIYLLILSKGAQTGAATITLPTTAGANATDFVASSLVLGNAINAYPTGTTQAIAYVAPNATVLTLQAQGTSVVNTAITNTTISNSTIIQVSGFYIST